MIDDERRAVAFQILDRQLQILELHAVAVEIDRAAAKLQPEQPERNLDAARFAPSSGSKAITCSASGVFAPGGGLPIGVRTQVAAVLIELDQGLLAREPGR